MTTAFVGLVCLILGLLTGSWFTALVLQNKAQTDTAPSLFKNLGKNSDELSERGVIYPSEEDVAEFLDERAEQQRRDLVNPFRGWSVYDPE